MAEREEFEPSRQ